MSQDQHLEFPCARCQTPLSFTLLELLQDPSPLVCCQCDETYDFSDSDLRRHLHKFAHLCQVLRDSEEILGDATVGVDVGPHRVEIPFRLLLTRLGTTLSLNVDDVPLSIAFRHTPARDPLFAQKETS